MQLQFDCVSKEFRGRIRALNEVSFSLEGTITGLIGPNGAGKSTLMNLLVGLSRPTGGHITLDGQPLEAARRRLLDSLGYLPQRFTPYPMLSVEEFLDYLAILKGIGSLDQRRARIQEALEAVHLEEFRKRRTATLSGGMRQRLGIAQAILNDPQLLVLDEPTAGLDPEERVHFRNLLAEIGLHRTVLVSSHIISDLSAVCERVLILERGRILYDGSPQALRERARGQIWEIAVPGDAFERLRQSAHIVSSRKEGSQVIARVVGKPGQFPGARPAEPALEDAYLWIHSEVQA